MDSLTERIVNNFLGCNLPKEEWTHQAHLRVGLWHLLQYSPCESLNKLRNEIKKYNVACGVENTETQGYQETITRFYVWLIERFIQQVDRSLLWNYYSKEQLMSKTAILYWVEPDLKPLSELK